MFSHDKGLSRAKGTAEQTYAHRRAGSNVWKLLGRQPARGGGRREVV